MKVLITIAAIFTLGAIEIEIAQDQFYVEGGVAYVIKTNQPLTGAVIYMYEKVGIKSKRRYYAGVLSGISESWYLNRQLEEQVSYANNKLNGLFKKWHRNGRLYAEGQYENGFKFGHWRVYDENGLLVNQLHYVPLPPPGTAFVPRPPRPPRPPG